MDAFFGGQASFCDRDLRVVRGGRGGADARHLVGVIAGQRAIHRQAHDRIDDLHVVVFDLARGGPRLRLAVGRARVLVRRVVGLLDLGQRAVHTERRLAGGAGERHLELGVRAGGLDDRPERTAGVGVRGTGSAHPCTDLRVVGLASLTLGEQRVARTGSEELVGGERGVAREVQVHAVVALVAAVGLSDCVVAVGGAQSQVRSVVARQGDVLRAVAGARVRGEQAVRRLVRRRTCECHGEVDGGDRTSVDEVVLDEVVQPAFGDVDGRLARSARGRVGPVVPIVEHREVVAGDVRSHREVRLRVDDFTVLALRAGDQLRLHEAQVEGAR